MLKFHIAARGIFGEITIFNEKITLKITFLALRQKNKDKWMGIVSYIEMICHN